MRALRWDSAKYSLKQLRGHDLQVSYQRKMFWDKIHVCMCMYVIPASALMGLVVVAQVWGLISSLACPVPLLHHLT